MEPVIIPVSWPWNQRSSRPLLRWDLYFVISLAASSVEAQPRALQVAAAPQASMWLPRRTNSGVLPATLAIGCLVRWNPLSPSALIMTRTGPLSSSRIRYSPSSLQVFTTGILPMSSMFSGIGFPQTDFTVPLFRARSGPAWLMTIWPTAPFRTPAT